MDDQIKMLNEKIDKLQATVDKLAQQIRRNAPVQRPYAFTRKTQVNVTSSPAGTQGFIGGGLLNSI